MKDERMVRAFDAMTPNAEERQRMRRKLQQNLQAVGARKTGGSRRVPRGVKKRVAVALAAAAVLLVSATALAATGFFGTIDWGGQRNDLPASMPSPTILPEIMDDLEAAVQEQLAAAPGDQIWSATLPDGSRNGVDLWESVGSLEMLRTRLAAAEIPFAWPSQVPEGYVLSEGKLWFYHPADASLRLLGSTESNGVVIERFSLDGAYDRCIAGYVLIYKNAAGDTLYVRADARNSGDESAFGVTETDTFETVPILGMDDALLFLRERDVKLYCRRMTPQIFRRNLLAEYWQKQSGTFEGEEWISMDSVVYEFSSYSLDADALKHIANNLKAAE